MTLLEQDNINIIGTINESSMEESISQSSIERKSSIKPTRKHKKSSSRGDLALNTKNKEEPIMKRYNSLSKKHDKKLSVNILSPNAKVKKPSDGSTPLSSLMKKYGTTVSKSKKTIHDGPIFFDFVQNLKNQKR